MATCAQVAFSFRQIYERWGLLYGGDRRLRRPLGADPTEDRCRVGIAAAGLCGACLGGLGTYPGLVGVVGGSGAGVGGGVYRFGELVFPAQRPAAALGEAGLRQYE